MPQHPLAEPPNRLRRIGANTRGAAIAGVLFSTLLLFNLAQLASLLLLPFSRRAFRSSNRWMADTWWGWCVWIGEHVCGVRTIVTGDEIPVRENVILVANHQQMPDITVLMGFARSKDRLGDLKWFVKKPIKYVPGVGWGMQFLDCPFVTRRWTEDEASIRRTFARLVSDRVPMWLVSFVEGTRITPSKLEHSRQYAEANGAAPPNHVLVPRTKGFVASVQALRQSLDAVYDVTIGYPEGVPTLWQYIKGQARLAHLHVRRHPITDLPAQTAELAQWLLRQFDEKDRLLERFYAEHTFKEQVADP
jgi:1-acyl-sn-glycerol-3-phosphate acyltransferase